VQTVISDFDNVTGETRYMFLSNFHLAAVQLDGELYPTTEHAYQAAKSFDRRYRLLQQAAASPGEAKSRGQRVRLRVDWEQVKVDVMRQLLQQKFKAGSVFAEKLLATGDAHLIEGNTWDDRFWGECPIGTGLNWLGRLLMEQRAALPQLIRSRQLDRLV